MQMKNKIREEKASMAVYVAVVLTAFLFILVGVCITLMGTRKGQLQTIMKIKESYEEINKKAGEIYNSISTSNTPNATITVSSTAVLTSGSITAEIRQEAGGGSLDFSKCKYAYNTTKGNIGTDVSSYTGGTLSSANSSITLSASTAGTYYLHVLTTNSGGSAIETISSPVAVVSTASINYATANTTSNPFSTFEAPANGTYKLQVWGAQGGYRSSTTYGGKGGYSIGTITLSKGDKLYVYVGGAGGNSSSSTGAIVAGGYNGGGYRYGYKGGGGATDIRLVSGAWNNSASLLSRVIVAGGGGSDGATSKKGMYGGGTTGGSSTENYTANSSYCGKGGTQTYSGYSTSYTVTTQATTGLNSNTTANYCGGFGFGGGGVYLSSGYGGAGGGGWYGGAGSVPDGSGDDDRGGGGGSGFVWTSGTASNVPSGYSVPTKYYLAGASTTDGNTSFTSTSGSTETGHSGNGYAKITPVTVTGKSSTTSSKPSEEATTGTEITLANGTKVKLTKQNVYEYLGKKVTNYTGQSSVTIGGTSYTVSPEYRLYYVDFDNKYGDGEGTIYLKAECTSDNYELPTTDTSSDTEPNIKIRALNPALYAEGVTPPTATNDNMKAVTWLTNTNNWASLADTSMSSNINYIVGSPSLEMMMDSYNTHYRLTGDTPNTSTLNESSARVKLFYKYPFNTDNYGYGVGPNNDSSATSGYHSYTSEYTVKRDTEIDTMYYPGDSKYYWLASPGTGWAGIILDVNFAGGGTVNGRGVYEGHSFCPLVSLKSNVQLQF